MVNKRENDRGSDLLVLSELKHSPGVGQVESWPVLQVFINGVSIEARRVTKQNKPSKFTLFVIAIISLTSILIKLKLKQNKIKIKKTFCLCLRGPFCPLKRDPTFW